MPYSAAGSESLLDDVAIHSYSVAQSTRKCGGLPKDMYTPVHITELAYRAVRIRKPGQRRACSTMMLRGLLAIAVPDCNGFE